MQSSPRLLDRLDPISQQTIHRVLLRVAMVIGVAVLIESDNRLLLLELILSTLAIAAGVVAVIRGDSMRDPALNYWDEMMAFLGVKHFIVAISSLAH